MSNYGCIRCIASSIILTIGTVWLSNLDDVFLDRVSVIYRIAPTELDSCVSWLERYLDYTHCIRRGWWHDWDHRWAHSKANSVLWCYSELVRCPILNCAIERPWSHKAWDRSDVCPCATAQVPLEHVVNDWVSTRVDWVENRIPVNHNEGRIRWGIFSRSIHSSWSVVCQKLYWIWVGTYPNTVLSRHLHSVVSIDSKTRSYHFLVAKIWEGIYRDPSLSKWVLYQVPH